VHEQKQLPWLNSHLILEEEEHGNQANLKENRKQIVDRAQVLSSRRQNR
jgi:hypothetical protein